MAREITAGVLLNLKDQFSSKIQGAGISVQGFADKAVGVAEKVNKAFSGVAGTLGTLGVSIGALSAVKSVIDLDDRMVRLGLTANADARQINALKRQIFEAAQMPDIKLDPDSIVSGLEVVMTKVGDLQFVENNVRNIALAIQASGESGDAMGAVFSEFAKFGYTMEEILPLMDDLIAQGDQGAFTFGEFAKNAPAVFSAYSIIGTTPEHIRKANAAMQILMAGTKSADIAVTALNHTMAELSEPDKQLKLQGLGINVRDLATREFRDFNDIMLDIVAKAEEMGNADYFGTIFGSVSMQAIRAYMTQGERMYNSLVNLGDTTGLLQQKSETMANTLKSNLQNLQTAFKNFADTSLSKPLQDLTGLLNKLAENPKQIEAGIRSITRVLAGLGAIKLGAGIVSFIANLNSLKTGGGLNMSGLASAGGGAGIPVRVTNWGGTASLPGGNAGLPGVQAGGGLVDQYGNPLPAANKPLPPKSVNKVNKVNWKGAATSAGISAAITAALTIPGMIRDLNEITKTEDLTDLEKGAAKGGAIGETVGAISGAAAGALTGAAIGSIIPGFGTALGAIVGGLIGQFGGPAGRAIGEKIGTAAAESKELGAAQNSYQEALEAAADTIGKTAEEIENARRKLTEAEARLEKAREANEAKKLEDLARKMAMEDAMNRMRYPGYNPSSYIASHPEALDVRKALELLRANAAVASEFPDSPGITQHNTNTVGIQRVNDLILTPQGQFNTHPDDYIIAMKDPGALVNGDLRSEARNEVRTVERVPQAIPPVVVEGSIELRSELTVDDKGCRLRQSVGKNTTPYKFAVGSAKNARLIQ